MKKIFILAFLIILPLTVIFTQTGNEDIVDLFQKFIATNPENFTMMPLDKNDLLKSS